MRILLITHRVCTVLTSPQPGTVTLTNPARDVRLVPDTPNILQGHLPKPLARLRGRHVPEGRPTEGRREAGTAQPAHGPQRHGRDDVGDEDADGHDGAADGNHGLDQFLLPGVRPE